MYGEASTRAGITGPGGAGKIDPRSPVSEIIEQAVSLHDFADPAEEALAALKALTGMAGAFNGGLDAFLDTLSLERGHRS